jgi:hypothetical protein
MKIKLFLAGCIFLLSVNLTAQSTEWLNTTQGSSHEFSNDIALDDSGNIYQVGSFIGTVDLDPTSGVSSFTSNNNSEDCFIRKFDANGNFLWVKSIGSISTEYLRKIEVFNDTIEFFFLAGDTMDLDPNIGIVNSNGGGFVLAKYDLNGNFISYLQKNSGFNQLMFYRIGNYRYAHSNYSSIDVDFGNNTQIISGDPNYYNNLFIAKYDLNFNLIWYKTIKDNNQIEIQTLKIDNNENVIYGGSFKGTFDINPDTGVKMLSEYSTNYVNYFISKLDNLGNFIFGKSIPVKNTTVDYELKTLILDNNEIFIAGQFSDSMDLNPDENIAETVYSPGILSGFILKLDNNGNKILGSKFGSNGANVYAFIFDNITKDGSNDVYLNGRFMGNMDFDISTANVMRNQIGSQVDFFVVKYSKNGLYKWVKQIDIELNSTNLGYYTDQAVFSKVLVAPNQKVFATGSFFGNTANFDTANTNFTATPPNGKYEGFLMRFNQPVVSLSIDILDFYGNANQKEHKNQLYLKYFTDENKQYSYNVLKSKDGIQWETILKKQAQINSTENQYFEDQNPFSGINYYKIEIFENDRFLKNSKIIAVNYLSNDYKLTYYNGALYSTIENDKIEIYDLMGKKIMDAHLENYKLDLSILNRNQFYIIKSKDANLKIIY